DDHARLLALSHELLRVRDVVVGTASDDFRSHDVGGGRGRRPTLCDDADGDVTVGDRAQHLLARVADRQEPDVRIAHAPGGLLDRLRRVNALYVALHDVYAAHRILLARGNPPTRGVPLDGEGFNTRSYAVIRCDVATRAEQRRAA